jgi:hypothetical protein
MSITVSSTRVLSAGIEAIRGRVEYRASFQAEQDFLREID